MNKVPTSALFLTDPTSMKWSRPSGLPLGEAFYQQLATLKAFGGIHLESLGAEMAGRILSAAEQAHAFRDWAGLEQWSDLLFRLSESRKLRGVGFYFRGLIASRLGKGDLMESSAAIHRAIEECTPCYRARAICSSAANALRMQDPLSELKLYVEAIRAASSQGCCDPMTLLTASRMVAIWKAKDGSHRAALSDLEKLFPLARAVGRWRPHIYYDYLNSLAVELAESGRLTEARNASRIVLASPYASAYPEWRETFEDISLKLPRSFRSTIAWSQPLVDMEHSPRVIPLRLSEVAEPPGAPVATTRLASVISLSAWREPVKTDAHTSAAAKLSIEEFERMSLAEKKEKFVELVLAGDTVDENKMDEAFRALCPNDRLMLLVPDPRPSRNRRGEPSR